MLLINEALEGYGGAQLGCSVPAKSFLTEAGTHQRWDLTFKSFSPCSEGGVVSLQNVPNPGYSQQCWNLPVGRTEMCYCCTSSIHCFRSFNLKYVNASYTEVLCNTAGEV